MANGIMYVQRQRQVKIQEQQQKREANTIGK